MGISPWYDVWCDHDGCINWTAGGPTRADAAKAARTAGWTKDAAGWACPEHQTDQEKVTHG